MKNEVFWKNPDYKVRKELKEDTSCDYLIVGGGVTGVSAAYFLAKAGAKNIIVVEKQQIGSGATGKAAGTLVTRGETDLTELIAKYGEKEALSLWQEIHRALREIKKVIDEEKIDCDAELQDTLMCGFKGKNWHNLVEEYEAEKRIEGTTKFLEKDDLKKEINSPLFTHGVLSKDHALSVNPLKFIQGFSEVIERYGVTVYEQTAVLRTDGDLAETEHGKIRYKKIIWATDVAYPQKDIKNLKTTIIVTRTLTADELVQIGFGERKKVVWDSRKNENYFKMTKDGRLLVGFGGIIVGKSHKMTDPHLPHITQLKNFIKKVFPYLDLEIEYAWSGHFGVHTHYSEGPLVTYEGDAAAIAGAGSQVVCFLSAEQVVKKLLENTPSRGRSPYRLPAYGRNGAPT